LKIHDESKMTIFPLQPKQKKVQVSWMCYWGAES